MPNQEQAEVPESEIPQFLTLDEMDLDQIHSVRVESCAKLDLAKLKYD